MHVFGKQWCPLISCQNTVVKYLVAIKTEANLAESNYSIKELQQSVKQIFLLLIKDKVAFLSDCFCINIEALSGTIWQQRVINITIHKLRLRSIFDEFMDIAMILYFSSSLIAIYFVMPIYRHYLNVFLRRNIKN